jgi:hypothetical protein
MLVAIDDFPASTKACELEVPLGVGNSLSFEVT